MRKLLVLVMVLALASIGCCTFTAPDGTVSKNFFNCLKIAQDKVCNATPEVMSVANMAVELAKYAISIAVPGSKEYMDAVGAYATATGIQATGCAMLTDLNKMIAFLRSPAAQAAETKLMAVKGPMKATAINVQPLIDWRDGKKK